MTDLKQNIPAWVDGVLTPVGKLEVHQRGLRHPAISVMILSGDDMLVQRRALGKYHTPGLWANACCTHPNWGEDPLSCANRRLREELGITGLDLALKTQLEYRADVGGGLTEHEVVDLFLAEVSGDLPMALNPDEVMAVRWISLADLKAEIALNPSQFTPWFRIYVAEHLDAVRA